MIIKIYSYLSYSKPIQHLIEIVNVFPNNFNIPDHYKIKIRINIFFNTLYMLLGIFFLQTPRAILSTNNFTFENSILWDGISGGCGFMFAGFFENNFRDGEVQAMVLILMGLCFNQIQKLKGRIFKS